MDDIVHYLDNGIVQSEIVNNESRFVMSGYWWGRGNLNKNSIHKYTYDQQVDRLVSQCKALKINYYFVEYPIFSQKGMYQKAINLKIQFMINTLQIFPAYTVVMIDTDLSILQYPSIFDMDADCFFINWNASDTYCFNPYENLLPGGIMAFSNSFNAKTMLNMFNKYLLKHSNLAEDKLFSGFFTRNLLNTYLRCVWLPYNYMYMYEHHTYTPYVGYTKLVTLEEELKDSEYKPKDIVIAHEDFETGALDDVFAQRVTKNRFPPWHYKQMGEKLRCLSVKFTNYLNYNLTKGQCKHLYKDTLGLVKDKFITNKLIKFITKKELTSMREYIIDHDKDIRNDGVLIVTICQLNVDKRYIDEFKSNIAYYNLNYLIIYTKSKNEISQPQLIYNTLLKYRRNVVFIDIYTQIKKNPMLFKVKNMDFMAINLDSTHLHEKKCSDIRVLKTLNDKLYFFAYNHVVLDFLSIWNSFNDSKHNDFQHKYLEYAFNKSMSINKLRCYWFPTDYISGDGGVLHYPKKYIGNYFSTQYPDKYSDKKAFYFTKNIQQCGTKPALKDGDPIRTHFSGSVHGTTYHNLYGKYFLEY